MKNEFTKAEKVFRNLHNRLFDLVMIYESSNEIEKRRLDVVISFYEKVADEIEKNGLVDTSAYFAKVANEIQGKNII